jgi:uncharacterized delta-60 repeat protein
MRGAWRWRIAIVGVAFLVLAPGTWARAAPGDLDPSFSGNGKVALHQDVEAVAVQADGRVVVGGGYDNAFVLTRFNSDGSRDGSFGDHGAVVTPFRTGKGCFADANAVLIQPADEKILAIGYSYCANGWFALARYNPDGSLDKTFGGDGKVMTRFFGRDGRPDSADANAAALQSDGRILATGRGPGGTFAVARYNPSGTLDTAFGGDGRVVTRFIPADDEARGVAVQANGRIVVVGNEDTGYPDNQRGVMARYLPNGHLDASFGAGGKLQMQLGPTWQRVGEAHAVTIQPDRRIVVVGDFAIVRYLPHGHLDSTFRGKGWVSTGYQTGHMYEPYAVVIQPDGRIVVGGSTQAPGFVLARYGPLGKLDATFGKSGMVTLVVPQRVGYAWICSLALQTDGNIVAGGDAATGMVMRFLGN